MSLAATAPDGERRHPAHTPLSAQRERAEGALGVQGVPG
jgi:hypothetical protein